MPGFGVVSPGAGPAVQRVCDLACKAFGPAKSRDAIHGLRMHMQTLKPEDLGLAVPLRLGDEARQGAVSRAASKGLSSSGVDTEQQQGRRGWGEFFSNPMSFLRRTSPLPPAPAAAMSQGAYAWEAQRTIRYLGVYEDDDCTIGVFCIPAGSQIPLHDHPGMTVVSRVLVGSLRVTSYDWETPFTPVPGADADGPGWKPPGEPRNLQAVARRRPQVTLEGNDPARNTHVLFPTTDGNLHAFEALTDVAVLDVLAPPYAASRGRDCTYFREDEGADPDAESVLLREFEPPDVFQVTSGKYLGPKPQRLP